MRLPRTQTGLDKGNWTRTSPLRLKSLCFFGLFRSKSPFPSKGLGEAQLPFSRFPHCKP